MKRQLSFLLHIFLLLALSACGAAHLPSRLPAARYGAVMVDPVGKQAIMFGGRSEGLFGILRYYNDLWAFDYSTQDWKPIITSRCPSGRLSPGMVYDPVHHQLIVFGGYDGHKRLGDTWRYIISENLWEEITPVVSPPARSDLGMAYDDENGVVILFGGMCQENQRALCDDTWIFKPDTNTWEEMQPPSSPLVSYGHALLMDPVHKQAILWGGHQQSITKDGQITSAGYQNQLWRYSFNENRWQELHHVVKPTARYWGQAAYDSLSQLLVIFGGRNSLGYLNDTWLYDLQGDTWKQVVSESAPTARVKAAMTYDPIHDVIILFGGRKEDFTDLQDTWFFDVKDDAGEWSLVEAP